MLDAHHSLCASAAGYLDRAKWAFSTRRVARSSAAYLDTDFKNVRAGDLILADVASLGHHQRIQLTSGRPSDLYLADLVVLPCGARYATDQFEGLAEIDPHGADMLAGGGCIGRMIHRNDRVKMPTRLRPIGRLMRSDGQPVNLADHALPQAAAPAELPVIGVFGAAMNAGKTTATAALVHGLRRAGWKVAALKGTGTGAYGDYNQYVDAGAHFTGDFCDAGMATTYLEPVSRIMAGMADLISAAEQAGANVVVMEIADGLLQRETAALIAHPEFRKLLTHTIFACGDPIAAVGGVRMLTEQGLRPAAVTGIISCSPMAVTEAEAVIGVQVLTRADLRDPAVANRFAPVLSFAGQGIAA